MAGRAEGESNVLRHFAGSNLMGLLFWNEKGGVTEANDAFLALVGYTREDLSAGRIDWKRMTPPEHVPVDEKALAELASRGTCTPFEKEYLRKDGSRVPVLIGGTRLSAEPLAGVAFVLDLTARNSAERSARDADLLSRQVIASANAGIAVLDTSLRYLTWNPEMERMSGLPAAEVLGRFIFDLFPALKEQGVGSYLDRALKGEVVHAPDQCVVTPGTRKEAWVSARLGPLTDSLGTVIGVIVMIRDISDRVRMEAERDAERKRVIHVLERVSDGFVALDRDWRYTYVNAHAGAIFGRRPEDLVGKHIWTEFPEGRGQKFHLAYERAMAEQVPLNIEEYYPPYDRWFENRIYPSKDGISIFFTDVTERKKAQEVQAHLASILDGSYDLVGFSDPDGNVKYVNPAGRRMVGLAEGEALPPHILDYVPTRLRDVYRDELLPAVIRAGVWRGETVFLHRDGTELPVSQVIVAHHDSKGRLEFISTIARDITEQKRAEVSLRESEARLREAQRVAHVGSYDIGLIPGYGVHWSDELFRILGIDPAQGPMAPQEFVARIVHPEDRGATARLLDEALRAEAPVEHEFRIIRSDGLTRWLLGQGLGVRDDEGRPARLVGTMMDITARKEAELALEESRRRLAEALDRTKDRVVELEEQVRSRASFGRFVGKSAPMQEVYRRLRLAAQSDVTVLLTGESGTGKELAARAIHDLGPRNNKPFVAVNCSAIPEALLESELFGHVKGSFTGAVRDKVGLFESAEGGTLFLDEVGDMPATLQVKVLRALQEREIRRVGDDRPIKVDVQLVTATNKDLPALLESRTMREDFYYRIRVFEIRLPPLRERKDDIPLLVSALIEELAKAHRKKVRGISADAMRRLMDHLWPGNVRELRNAIEHAFVTVSGDHLRLEDLPASVREASGRKGEAGESSEAAEIREALRKTGGNRAKAAKLLGVSRVTLWKRMRRHGLKGWEAGE